VRAEKRFKKAGSAESEIKKHNQRTIYRTQWTLTQPERSKKLATTNTEHAGK